MAIGGTASDWRTGTQGAPTSLTDFTAKTLDVNPSWSADLVDATVFGKGSKVNEVALLDGTISVRYKHDTTIYGQLAAIYTSKATVNFQLSPIGTGSGAPKTTGAAFMTSISAPQAVGELLVIEVEFQCNDTVTFTTH